MRHEHGFKAAEARRVPTIYGTDATRAAAAFLSTSQTHRRLAHRAKREAIQWEAQGHRTNYLSMRLESDRLWRSAKWNLNQARLWRE